MNQPAVTVPACPTGRHRAHDDLTCTETDAVINAERSAVLAALDRALSALDRTPMSEVPSTLRGPNWSSR